VRITRASHSRYTHGKLRACFHTHYAQEKSRMVLLLTFFAGSWHNEITETAMMPQHMKRSFKMSKSIANEVKTAKTLNTLEAQGHELGKRWKRMEKAGRDAIVTFDKPLGDLLMTLRKESNDGKQISRKRLLDCGIANIDRRRRSEAEALAKDWNNPVMQELLASKRFSSTTTLIR
jgi:glycyl-tRNA synthetase (class II)